MEELYEACYFYPVKGGIENVNGKVNILLQAYVSQLPIKSFSLVSDMNYITQNAGRLFRAIFEIAIKKNLASMSFKLLTLCKAVEQRLWWTTRTPLRQVTLFWRG